MYVEEKPEASNPWPANHLIWVVVGDMSKVEAGIRELNLGEIHKIDADGNPVQGLPPAVIKARRKAGFSYRYDKGL
jgi:hypothetical protein